MVRQNATDAVQRASSLKGRLDEVVREARQDIGNLDDPKAQALFETTAEVALGLMTALDHFEGRSEPAWR